MKISCHRPFRTCWDDTQLLYALHKWDNHLIFIYEKPSKADTRDDSRAEYHAWPASGFLPQRVVHRIDQSHNHVWRSFPAMPLASLRTSAFHRREERKDDLGITSLFMFSARKKPSQFSFKEKIASRYNNCAWNPTEFRQGIETTSMDVTGKWSKALAHYLNFRHAK